ncbi:MAG: 30S ribosomal protein S2 [Planctomycetota bacterium]|jgi:small subunit ribosomal protein S2|nr:30S ribosomal protein S2 [Planctomycetota bacterium]
MAIASLKEMVAAGVHFGSAASRWNPKMKPFIFSKQNKIHIIDLRETLKWLIRSWHFLAQTAANGKQILFVGTKRQATDIIRQEAMRCESYFVSNRWLGGTLTNMNTMRRRITRLQELEELEKSGQLQEFSKKMIASLTRERKKIFRNFEGIRDMKELPGAIVMVDPATEHIAVAEGMRLGVPLVALIDTDDDPTNLDFAIPGNDDAFCSIQYIVSKLANAIIEGKKRFALQGTVRQRAEGGGGEPAPAEPAPAAAKEIETPSDFSQVGGFSYGGGAE